MAATIFEFGEFTLDCNRFELRRAGRILKLEKKPMELLILLAARNGDLVTRTEIVKHLWGREVFVDTEHGINTAVRKIRQVLRDDPEQPRFLRTVTGKGYRFIESIVAVQLTNGEGSQPPAAEDDHPVTSDAAPSPAPSAATKPHRLVWIAALSVLAALAVIVTVRVGAHDFPHGARPKIGSLAVLPLDNFSGGAGQDYFADGTTDELITMLAKNSTLRIVSRTSVMQYKRAHRPLREIGRELGVDGVLEGSVARSSNRVHMAIQLIYAPTDTHVWADSFDRETGDSVLLPKEVAQAVAKQLHSAVSQPAPCALRAARRARCLSSRKVPPV